MRRDGKIYQRLDMSGYKEISDFVLKYDYCCGCGVCAGVCPQDALQIRFNESGEYRPYLVGSCTDCGLCSMVCPFVNGNPDEDDIGCMHFAGVSGTKHTSETGYYLSCLMGHSTVDGHQKNGASGGMATWMLETLLRLGEVERVACVRPRSGGHPLFEFVICQNIKEVRACSRSSYYPVEISSIVRQILSDRKRYAVIGLPCVCKALRLCAQANPRLRDRVKYILGLTCGHGLSSHFSEYVFGMAGGKPCELHALSFRVKSVQRCLAECGTVLVGRNAEGEYERQITWSQGVWPLFKNRYFTPLACDLCDDVFAECADATFMDAWLPEYARDREGHSIVLIRNPAIRSILQEHVRIGCALAPIDVGRVVQSQKGALRCKRAELPVRMEIFRRLINACIPRRSHVPGRSVGFVQRLLVEAQWRIARRSSTEWRQADRRIDTFRQRTRYLERHLLWLNCFMMIRRSPLSAIKKMVRKVCKLLPM